MERRRNPRVWVIGYIRWFDARLICIKQMRKGGRLVFLAMPCKATCRMCGSICFRSGKRQVPILIEDLRLGDEQPWP